MTTQYFASLTKQQLFWLLQSCGWLVYSLVFIWDNIFFNLDDTTPAWLIIIHYLFFGLIGLACTLFLRAIYRRLDYLGVLLLIPICLVLCLIVGVFWNVVKKLLVWYFLYPEALQKWLSGEIAFSAVFFLYSNSFFIFVVWTAFYFSVNAHFKLIEQTKKLAAIETDNERAKFQLLRYQLNPHFLFNSLNAASNLALSGNGERTNEVLAKLSNFLRFTLDISPNDKMSLKQDMEIMEKYLDIEKIRFGQRLQVKWDIAKNTEAILVPSFLIQPLIENSIKHAVSNNVNPTTLTISAQLINDSDLALTVSDDGPLTDLEQLNHSSGIGQANIKKRLELFYGNDANIRYSVTSPHGLTCSIVIQSAITN